MKAKNGFKLRPLGDEFILLGEGIEQVNFNKMITMNSTAAYLWQKVENGRDFDAQGLAELLVEEYEVDKETALRDAQKTLETWLNADIIE